MNDENDDLCFMLLVLRHRKALQTFVQTICVKPEKNEACHRLTPICSRLIKVGMHVYRKKRINF